MMQKRWKKKREEKCQKKLIILMVGMRNLLKSNAKNKNDRIVTQIIVWCTSFSILSIVENIFKLLFFELMQNKDHCALLHASNVQWPASATTSQTDCSIVFSTTTATSGVVCGSVAIWQILKLSMDCITCSYHPCHNWIQ